MLYLFPTSRNLADVDSDGQLTCEEFCLAMYLVEMAKSGQPMPAKLPPDLIPPSQRRTRSGSVQAGSATAAAAHVPPAQTNSTPALNQGMCVNILSADRISKNWGPCFNIKMSYQYRKSHCGDKMIIRSSYLHNGISYTGNMTSLYWNSLQGPVSIWRPSLLV